MTAEERDALIEYIKDNDRMYNYNAVNFKYYTDEDLLILKQRIDQELLKRGPATRSSAGTNDNYAGK
jgi:hypothetical protein